MRRGFKIVQSGKEVTKEPDNVPRIRTGLARWVISALSEKCYLRRTAPSYRSSVLIYMW